jgi:hypothetical protein
MVLFTSLHTIHIQDTIYVTVLDGGEENPLLDSRFPDVSGKGRGYQIQALKNGLPEWPELRKISVWQTVSALEQVRCVVASYLSISISLTPLSLNCSFSSFPLSIPSFF